MALLVSSIWATDQSSSDPMPCPNQHDYSPCVCYKGTIKGTEELYYGVICDRLPLADVKEAFSKFGPAEIGVINLNLPETDDFVPEDVLAGGKQVVYIQVVGPNEKKDFQVKIHPEAFRSNADYTEAFYMSGMDFSRMDFEFLQGFDLVDFIKLFNINNFEKADWSTLPILAKLTRIEIGHCSGLNDWTTNFPPAMTNGVLNEINLTGNYLTDSGIQRLLEWVYQSAKKTLKVLNLSNNGLTKVPKRIANFETLERLDLSYNKLHTVAAGSLAFKAPVSRLWLYNAEINTIEPGAFKGFKLLI